LEKCAKSSAEELDRTLETITKKVLSQQKTEKLIGKYRKYMSG